MTKADFCRRVVGRSPEVVSAWITRDLMPVLRTPAKPGDDYWIDVPAAVAWLVENKRIDAKGKYQPREKAQEGEVEDARNWERREQRVKALARELDYDRAAGRSVYVDELAPLLTELVIRTRAALLTMAPIIASALDGRSAEEMVPLLEAELDARLEALSLGEVFEGLKDVIADASKRD